MKTVIAWTLALVPWRVCSVFDDVEDNCWLAESLYKDFSSEFLKTRKAKVRGKPRGKRYKMLVKGQASHNADDWNTGVEGSGTKYGRK